MIINPRRIANHVYSNHGTIIMIESMLGALGDWLGVVTSVLGYMLKSCKCHGRKDRNNNVREALERHEEGRPLRNNL